MRFDSWVRLREVVKQVRRIGFASLMVVACIQALALCQTSGPLLTLETAAERKASAARWRVERVQDELRMAQASPGEARQEQQETLHERVFRLQQALGASTYPAATIPLRLRLQTATIERDTADYQQQLTKLRQEVRNQETLNSQVRQDTDRLVSLAEQYASGERVPQRLLIKFEHLHRERGRFTANLAEVFTLPAEPVRNPQQLLGIKWRGLNETLFDVDDQLYEFDRLARDQVNQLTGALLAASPSERAAALSGLHANLEAQRTALQAQQQVLADLTQTASQLIALHDAHKQLLDDGYRLVLSKMFWLKNSVPLGWTLVGDMAARAKSITLRIAAAMRSDLSRLGLRLQHRVGLWGLFALLLVVLPLVVRRIWSHLRTAIHASLSASKERGKPPAGIAMLLVLQAAVWPAYLALFGWSRQFFVPLHLHSDETGMAAALVSGVYLAVVVLAIGLFSRALFRPNGWGQQFWQLDDAECLFLRRSFGIGCIGGLLFLVPRQVVLAASPDAFLAGGDQALERLLMLAFQGVIFGLALRVGWPSGPLMARILARSRERDGLLWRVWPLILIVLLTALAGVMVLDVFGYHYTARFIWLRGLETLSIVLGSRLLLFLLMYGAQRLARAMYDPGRRWHDPARQQAAERSLAGLRSVSRVVLSIAALLLILELWGVLRSQAGSQIMTRVYFALMTILAAMLVIHISNVLVEHIVRPRLTVRGETRKLGRKSRTLIPLVQTILKVVVVFVAVLILLELVNIRTGPLLAGLGLFGLAVGLASQSLIKDVINGLFILFEDSLSVGDIATLRGISGEIEKITLRAVVLRDLQGDVHVIPNSTIDLVTNKTKVFSRYLLNVGVAYREDVDVVIDMLREVDEDMHKDMRYGYNMLEPIEIWGLDRFEDSAMYIQARLKTRPGKQWEVGREFNRRMKKVFDERGIEIPFPHRTVYWGMPKEGTQPSIRLSVNDPGV